MIYLFQWHPSYHVRKIPTYVFLAVTERKKSVLGITKKTAYEWIEATDCKRAGKYLGSNQE